MTAAEATQILVGFGALVAFLTGFSSLRQRQRLEFIRESVRAANERLEDLAERQDALPLPATAMNQELRPAAGDPLGALVISLSVGTAAMVGVVWWRAVEQGQFTSSEIAGLLSVLAVLLIVVTAAVGLFDVLWGRRQVRMTLQYSTVRQVAVVLLRFLLIGRLILIQQFHRSLLVRLDPADGGDAAGQAEILRRIAQLPGLLPGAGVPPWTVAKAQRRARRALRDGESHLVPAHGEELEHLEAEALRASLIIRQFRPSVALWESFSDVADELRGRLAEWEWVDLMVAWSASGLLPPSADSGELHAVDTMKRLTQLDYERSLGIHHTSRETDSRDLAAWTIADAIQRRSSKLASYIDAGGAALDGTLWDDIEVAAARSDVAIRTSVRGFSARDPFVWLALTVPKVDDAVKWITDHFVVDEAIRWRARAEAGQVASGLAATLARPPRVSDEHLPSLDATLADKVIGHPINDSEYWVTIRGGAPADFSELFRRYAASEIHGRRLPRVPMTARIEGVVLPLRWFFSLRARDQALFVGVIVAVVVLLNMI